MARVGREGQWKIYFFRWKKKYFERKIKHFLLRLVMATYYRRLFKPCIGLDWTALPWSKLGLSRFSFHVVNPPYRRIKFKLICIKRFLAFMWPCCKQLSAFIFTLGEIQVRRQRHAIAPCTTLRRMGYSSAGHDEGSSKHLNLKVLQVESGHKKIWFI